MSASFLSGVKKLDLTHMEAGSPTGEASHDGLAYHDKGIDLTANQRTVDPGFTSVAQLAGPDAGLMSTMIGYKESDANLKWQILPHLNLDASIQDTINRETNQASRLHQMTANWSPDATTKIEFFGLDQSNHDPLSTVFASNIDRLTMSKSLGRYGVLTFSDESQQFDQSVLAAQGITGLTSYNTQYFSYEAKLTPKTSFKTEEALTEFSNGERQSVNAETISTAITPRLGVSVSDVNIDHKGGDQAPDSMVAHRNAGFYYDLGHGLIFNYGYARQLAPNDGGTTTTEMTLGGLPPNTTLGAMPTPDKIGTVPPGMIGDFTVTGGYAANQWDSSNRTQAFSNLAITAVKPFQLGPLSNVKFGAAMDSATDYSNWIKEDRNFLFTGNLGPNALGLMYKSQLAQPNVQAIDRGFMLVSDPSNLRWFNAAISYKARTLPNDQDMLIRSYALSARIVKGLQISNQFQTEPEIAQPAALLGSVAQATRSDKWKLEYATTPNLTLGGSWEEMRNDASGTMARTAGLNAKLWDQSGSPVTIFYGMEQADNPTLTRTTARYSIQYDQRPGPNQMLSVFLGNISYVGSVPQGFQTDNWTVRINYQLRF